MTAEARRLLLHIGSHKTGSTSIQLALVHAEANGNLRPARYPIVGSSESHHQLASSYLPYEKWGAGERAQSLPGESGRAKAFRRYRGSLFSQLRTADRAILSSEVFTWLPRAAIGRLRRDLESLGFEEFLIVLYVRDPADYYLSLMQELLKRSAHVVDPVSFRYPVRSLVEEWEQVFPGCMAVRAYLSDAKFDVVQDFSRITQDFLGASVSSIPMRANETVSAEGMQILQSYRSTFWPDRDDVPTPDSLRLAGFLQRSRALVPQTPPELRPEVAAWIRACHREDFASIARRYGVDLQMDCADMPRRLEYDQDNLRVADVLQRVDQDTVTELLFRIAEEGHWGPQKRGLTNRIASRLLRMYRPGRRMPGVGRCLRRDPGPGGAHEIAGK